MQIRALAGSGAAGVDDDDPLPWALLPGFKDALIHDRMTPSGVGSHQHNEVRKLQVLITAGHGIRAKGTLVARDGRRHAEPGVSIDVGRADEALHELVGDVIFLSEELPGDIEGHSLGSVVIDDTGESVHHKREGLVPRNALASDLWIQQATL